MRIQFKRLLSAAMSAAMLVSMCATATAAAPDPVTVRLDGAQLPLSQSAFVDGNHRTQVPVSLGETLGLTVQQSGDKVTFTRGNAALTFETGAQKAGDITMDTAPVQGCVPVAYLARYFGYGITWNAAARAVELTSPVQPSQAVVAHVQAYNDMCFYGQKLVKVEIQYAPGTDLTGIPADGSSYVLWDRGSADPTFAPVKVTGAAVDYLQGMVTLSVTTDTEATTERTRNAVGAMTTGAWYVGLDNQIYFGKEEGTQKDPITGDVFHANVNNKGYQTRNNLDLILCHSGEEITQGLRLTDGLGNYVQGGKWLPTVNNTVQGFDTLYVDVNDAVSQSTGTAYVAPGYQAFEGKVPVSIALPEGYSADKQYPMVVYVCGGGTSYWELYDEAGKLSAHNPGTNLNFDNAALGWTDQDVIVVSPHVHSNANTQAAHEVAAVVQYCAQNYGVNEDKIIFVGNSNGTLILSETVRMYPGLADVFFVVNGDLGAGGHTADADSLANWSQAELTAMAESGLAVWLNRGETDLHIRVNQRAYDTIVPYYQRAGFSPEWIADNLRMSAFMSWNFKYWGETDHSCTRLLWGNYGDQLYLKVFQDQPELKPGDTYRLTGEEKFDYAGADQREYTVYGDTHQQWAVSREK